MRNPLAQPGRDYEARFKHYMQRAEDQIEPDLDAMFARHSAAGRLQSGATLIAAVEIWEARSRENVDAALREFASLIPDRGKEWTKAITAAAAGFGYHRSGARQALGRAFVVARPPGGEEGGAAKAIEARLDDVANAIAHEISAFRDGWTAPVPTRWNERHPVAFAVLMALVGAVLALAGGAIAQ